jgi:uncharacterized protein YndB with AHSA1/START domain
MRRKCEASVKISASPEAIWAVISDVTRVGEWSGECRRCEWVGDARAPVPGARFRGRNHRGGVRWTRLNEVIGVARPHTLVWRTVARAPYLDSTEWRMSLVEEGEGTRVSESFQVLKMSRLIEAILWLAMPAHRDRNTELADDLARLKGVVESGGGADL